MDDQICGLTTTCDIDPRCVAEMVVLKDIIPHKSSGLFIWSILDLEGVIVEMTLLHGYTFLKVYDRASKVILEYAVPNGSLIKGIVQVAKAIAGLYFQ